MGLDLEGRAATATMGICAALLVASGVGCQAERASGPIAFPVEPTATLGSDSGQLQIAVRTSPQPAVKGVNAVQYVVTDALTGAPIDGLDVVAVPWMPAHGHGTTAKTTVEPQGDGVYQITDVYLYMDGTWELRSSLTAGTAVDGVSPTFDVP
jgi:hypothetical protein